MSRQHCDWVPIEQDLFDTACHSSGRDRASRYCLRLVLAGQFGNLRVASTRARWVGSGGHGVLVNVCDSNLPHFLICVAPAAKAITW